MLAFDEIDARRLLQFGFEPGLDAGGNRGRHEAHPFERRQAESRAAIRGIAVANGGQKQEKKGRGEEVFHQNTKNASVEQAFHLGLGDAEQILFVDAENAEDLRLVFEVVEK